MWWGIFERGEGLGDVVADWVEGVLFGVVEERRGVIEDRLKVRASSVLFQSSAGLSYIL
jgi:pantoate kinase